MSATPTPREAAGITTVEPSEPESAAPSRPRRFALAVSAIVLALMICALWVQATFPSDGLLFLTGGTSWPADGIPVTPLSASSPGPIRHGDIVRAVNGRSLDSWARALFDPGAAHPALHIDQRLTYSILRDGRRHDVVVTLGEYPFIQAFRDTWGTILFALTFSLVALFIYVRRPHERLTAPLLVTASALCCVVIGSFALGIAGMLNGVAFWFFTAASTWADSLFLAALLHTVLLFPQPNPLTTKWRWLIPTIYVVPFLAAGISLAVARLLTPSTVAWIGTWQPIQRALSIVFEALVAIVIVWTYRASTDEVTRQKIRWVVFGGVVALVGTLLLWFIPLFLIGHILLDVNAVGLIQVAFPVCLAIAILRHRLFDIDTIINRAMVYGTLTVTLATVYFICVVAMETLARAITGQSQPHPLVVVLSTLAIAALIQPLRHRIQAAIDRHFYRHKYDAARILQAFGATLRHEVDLHGLSNRLVGVVDDTMQPAFISLWLRPQAPEAVEHLAPVEVVSHPLVADGTHAEADAAAASTGPRPIPTARTEN